MKTRFCPSPTGLMHLGNTRTALFNALFAHGHAGILLYRLEDTDRQRSEQRFAEILEQDLNWLGLHWQEGPGTDGPNGPYLQSERQPIYDRYYHILEDKGLAYSCFCSEEQLALMRKVQQSAGQPPRYVGTCRHLTAAEVEAKIAAGQLPTLRFKVPEDQEVVFQDLVHGEQRFKTNDLGDFIIRRTDGTSPFMFCNAIDDALMGVTHALRGVDHLTNTPRQVMILRALDLPIPHYGHISLITGPDGSPLSKRHGSKSVKELRELGYLPLALVNYLARLGHYYENPEFMSFADLAKGFSIEHLSRSPARFDAEQLLHWQKLAVAQCNHEQLWQWMGSEVQQLVPSEYKANFLNSIQPNIIFPKDALNWAKVFFSENFEIEAEAQNVLEQTDVAFFTTAAKAVQMHGLDHNAVCEALKTQLNVKGKALFQPLRAALTGALHGPELVHIFALIGKDRMMNRLTKITLQLQKV